MRFAAALVVFAGLALTAHGQEIATSGLKFNSGQSVQPAYEGWTRNPDGSRSMWFGYLNRNWEETPDIPAGTNNGFGAGSEDLGQPTHFLPRRQAFVFKVNVPADWPADKDLVWTLTANGTTLKAFGSLWPVWEIDEQTMSANNGGRTARTFGEPVNLPPAIVSQLPAQSVAVGQPLTLVLPVKDDGLPTPEIRARGTGGPRGRGTPPNAAAPDPFAEARARSVSCEVGAVPRRRQGQNRARGIGGARRRRQAVADRREVEHEGHIRSARQLHAARVRTRRRRILCHADVIVTVTP